MAWFLEYRTFPEVNPIIFKSLLLISGYLTKKATEPSLLKLTNIYSKCLTFSISILWKKSFCWINCFINCNLGKDLSQNAEIRELNPLHLINTWPNKTIRIFKILESFIKTTFFYWSKESQKTWATAIFVFAFLGQWRILNKFFFVTFLRFIVLKITSFPHCSNTKIGLKNEAPLLDIWAKIYRHFSTKSIFQSFFKPIFVLEVLDQDVFFSTINLKNPTVKKYAVDLLKQSQKSENREQGSLHIALLCLQPWTVMFIT